MKSPIPARELHALMERSYLRRTWISKIKIALLALAAFCSAFPLFCVFFYVVYKGLPGLSVALVTELPKPVGEPGGGIANAILGTFSLVSTASIIGVPWGIATGIYLS